MKDREGRAHHVFDLVPTRRVKRTNNSRSLVETIPSDVKLTVESATTREFYRLLDRQHGFEQLNERETHVRGTLSEQTKLFRYETRE